MMGINIHSDNGEFDTYYDSIDDTLNIIVSVGGVHKHHLNNMISSSPLLRSYILDLLRTVEKLEYDNTCLETELRGGNLEDR